MPSQQLILYVNEPQSFLQYPLSEGRAVNFSSTSLDGVPDKSAPEYDNSSVNILKGPDALLHVSIRRRENRIVFNTRTGTSFGKEEEIKLEGVFSGPYPSITVVDKKDTYDIYFDNRLLKTYTKRIKGDGTSISYNVNPDQRPVFSNPITAEVFGPTP